METIWSVYYLDFGSSSFQEKYDITSAIFSSLFIHMYFIKAIECF